MTDSLERCMSKLSKELDKITRPKTPLEIIYTRNESKKIKSFGEAEVQKILFYFLNPHEDHGLSINLLDYILNSIDEHIDFENTYSPSELNSAQVEQEVSTGGKQADALIWVKRDFFICWEIKIGAHESHYEEDEMYQTEKYARADEFSVSEARLKKESVPPENHHYVYIKKQEKPPAKSDSFDSISWEWIANELLSWLNKHRKSEDRDYPQRTIVEMYMLARTIRRQICDVGDSTRSEKADLYAKYYEEISEIEDASD